MIHFTVKTPLFSQ